MQETNFNAKCPHCGVELYVGYNQGRGFCPTCRKDFDNDKAIKLYQTIHAEDKKEEEKRSASYGEEYLEVEKILTRADFYFERKEFRKAREELEKALVITNTDYRVYFGIVRAETKDLTDYRNTTHKEFLEKAIECADAEEKKVITRLYKDFYHLSMLPDEDILQYKKEENIAIKSKLETKFKEIIPFYMKRESSLKAMLIACWSLVPFIVASAVMGFVIESPFILVISVILMAVCYFLGRRFSTGRRQVILFNSLLDVYDVLDTFDLDVYMQREVLDRMKTLRKLFSQKNNLNECEDVLAALCSYLETQTTENARIFIINHRTLCQFTNAYEEPVNADLD